METTKEVEAKEVEINEVEVEEIEVQEVEVIELPVVELDLMVAAPSATPGINPKTKPATERALPRNPRSSSGVYNNGTVTPRFVRRNATAITSATPTSASDAGSGTVTRERVAVPKKIPPPPAVE